MLGSKTKFVCFRKCMHGRYIGHKRFTFCCFTADGSAKSRNLIFFSVTYSSMFSDLRHPTLFISELCPCSYLTTSPASHHALELWSDVESRCGVSLYRGQVISWWSGFMNTSHELVSRKSTNRPHCIFLGYHRLRQWWAQIQRFPRTRVDIINSIGYFGSDDRNSKDPQNVDS